jgi:hypothetical protein
VPCVRRQATGERQGSGDADPGYGSIYTPENINPLTYAQADELVCKRLLAIGDGWDARADKIVADREAPYRKVGITGEKLDFLLNHDVVGVGQRPFASKAAMARTNVFFELLLDGDEYKLVRDVFSGNTHAGQTVRGTLVQPGPEAYR